MSSAPGIKNIGDIVKNVRVLIVEDEEIFRSAMVFEFERHGFLVSCAENGHQAMELLQKLSVQVVITDIRMPGMGGIELLDYIKKNQPTVPIVMMMTGFAEISSEEALARGAEALFSKPFDRKAMTEAVKKLVVAHSGALETFTSAIQANLKIAIHFDHTSAIESRVVSLSEKGLFVSLENSFPQISDDVNFDLHFDDNNVWRSGNGSVRWVCFKAHQGLSPGVGIAFSHVSEDNKQKIADIIKKNVSNP